MPIPYLCSINLKTMVSLIYLVISKGKESKLSSLLVETLSGKSFFAFH